MRDHKCSFCRKYGHIRRYCPEEKLQKYQAATPIDPLLDPKLLGHEVERSVKKYPGQEEIHLTQGPKIIITDVGFGTKFFKLGSRIQAVKKFCPGIEIGDIGIIFRFEDPSRNDDIIQIAWIRNSMSTHCKLEDIDAL